MRVRGARFSAVILATSLSLPFPADAGPLDAASAMLGAAKEQVHLLFGRTRHLLDGYEKTSEPAGIHLDRLNLAIGEHAVPLATFGTFAPDALKGSGDGRLGIFGAGEVRLDPDNSEIESNGVSLGADFEIRQRMSVGAALGYSRVSTSPDAVTETTTLAVHGAASRGGIVVELVAGGGLTHATETPRQDRPVLFSGGRARWDLAPLAEWAPHLRVTPSISATGALTTAERAYGTAMVTTGLAASREFEGEWGFLTPHASIERKVEAALLPSPEPGSTLRIGADVRIDGGPALSIEHIREWTGRDSDHRAITGRLKMRF